MSSETPGETPGTRSDREILLEIESGIREIRDFITTHTPALDRAMRFMKNPVADYLAARSRGPRT